MKRYIHCLCLLSCCAIAAHGQTLMGSCGRVADAQSGAPLAGVAVSAADIITHTDQQGRFCLAADAPPLTTPIFPQGQVVSQSLTCDERGAVWWEVRLAVAPQTIADSVTVSAQQGLGAENAASLPRQLRQNELQQVTDKFVGDPLRAAQTLPGVAGNDDLSSRLSLRGAEMRRIAFFIDGVQTEVPLHTLGEGQGGGSVSSLNAQSVGALNLLAGAYPARYGNSTAGALLFETREGNRERPGLQFTSGLTSTAVVAEGPLPQGRGAWLATARRSYLNYVLRRMQQPGLAFDFADWQTRTSYEATPHQQFGLTTIRGGSGADQHARLPQLSFQDLLESDSRSHFASAYWSYAPNARWFVQTRLFALGAGLHNRNVAGLTVARAARSQWGVRHDWQWQAAQSHLVESGVYWQSLFGAQRQARQLAAQVRELVTLNEYRRASRQQSYYAQDQWRRARLSVTGGLRLEHSALNGQTIFTPRLGASFAPREGVVLRFGLSRHAQFPDFEHLFGLGGATPLRAEQAMQWHASLEQQLPAHWRLTAEVFARSERGLLFSLDHERLRAGAPPTGRFPLRNSLHGWARGFEFTLQRREAGRWEAWLSYAYTRTQQRDGASELRFVSDADQRHTLSAYASYRFSETLDSNALWRFGSGLPLVGWQPTVGPALGARNQFRLPVYSRVDWRLNKRFNLPRFKLTVTAEFLNLLGRRNLRQAPGGVEPVLPFIPSGGVTIQF